MKPLSAFFDGQLTSVTWGCAESVGPAAAAAAWRRPVAAALLCSVRVLSLAWPASLHLMVYSFHSGAGCCATRILSHSIYLPGTVSFFIFLFFLPHGHLNWFALIWSLEREPFSKSSENRKYSPLLSMTTDVLFFYGVIPSQFLLFVSVNIPLLYPFFFFYSSSS